MQKPALTATLAHLHIAPRELALLIEESEALALAWTSGAERTPRWLEMLVTSWRDHPQMLAIARETAAARLGEPPAIEDDVVFARSA